MSNTPEELNYKLPLESKDSINLEYAQIKQTLIQEGRIDPNNPPKSRFNNPYSPKQYGFKPGINLKG